MVTVPSEALEHLMCLAKDASIGQFSRTVSNTLAVSASISAAALSALSFSAKAQGLKVIARARIREIVKSSFFIRIIAFSCCFRTFIIRFPG